MASAYVGHKCFVANIGWTMDNDALKNAFSKYGEIIEAQVMKDNETGRSRGFGFVIFTTEKSMRDAIEGMNDQELNGRQVSVDEAPSRGSTGGSNQPQIQGGGNGMLGTSASSLILAGPWTTMLSSLKNGFSKYGEIIEAQVMKDSETGISRGFGFVIFKTEKSMRDAIEGMNDKELNGRQVSVDEAPSRGSGGSNREGGGFRSYGRRH